MPTCSNCNTKFPILVFVDGKTRNLQRRKFCLTCSPFGAHNNKQYISKQGFKSCTNCKKEFPLDRDHFYYQDSKHGSFSSTCIDCRNQLRIDQYRRVKARSVAYKGGKCVCCGYDKCIRAFDFHHLKQEDKDFTISQIRSRSFESIKKELDKTVLVCSNCHREIHDGYRTIAN